MTFAQAKNKLSTTQYQFAHGRKPSGTGYWGFEFKFTTSKEGPMQFWDTGKYSEVKTRALRAAQLWESSVVAKVEVMA